MNIRLNVKKNTFRQYLLELGYNYNIKQYDDFIQRLGNIIISEVKESILEDNLETIINKIFNKTIDILFLGNYLLIENIKGEYLTELIESGILDLYLIEENINVSEEIKESIYIRNKLNKLDFIDSRTEKSLKKSFKNLYSKASAIYKQMKKCENILDIDIIDERKLELNSKIKEKIIYLSYDVWGNNDFDLNSKASIEYDEDKLETFLDKKLKGVINLSEPILKKYIFEIENEYVDEKRIENIRSKFSDFTEDKQDNLIKLFYLLSNEAYIDITYMHELHDRLRDYNKADTIWLSDIYRDGRLDYNGFSRHEQYNHIYEMREELSNSLNIIGFDLSIDINGKKHVIKYEELKENGIIKEKK